MRDRSYARFPVWLELSGLPAALAEKARTANTWAVFRKIVELDIVANPARPGLVEVSLGELAERTGTDVAKIEKAVAAMRKLALLRAFLPDTEEEAALFQILTPIPTPLSPEEVRARHGDLFLEGEWPPRYAVEVPEEDQEGDPKANETKIKRVVDLYLNTFSMKLNSLILEQLQMISERYDYDLIEKVFQRARKAEARSLGWILSEIRRETKLRAKAEEIRNTQQQSSL